MRNSYAHITSTLALVVALSGTAYAATQVTSANIKNDTIKSADIKNGGIKGKDVSAAAKAEIRGSAGQIVTTRPADSLLIGGRRVLELSLAAGSWSVVAHVGGAHNGVAASIRFECVLSHPNGELDFAKVRLQPNTDAVNSLVFADVSLNGAVTLPSAGVIQVECYLVGLPGDSVTLTGLAMTATRGQSVVVQ